MRFHCSRADAQTDGCGQGALMPDASIAATKIVLNLVVVTGKIERENTLLRHENQSPSQTGPAFADSLAKFADGNPRVRVRIAEAVLREPQSGRHFIFPTRFPHNLLEPSRQFNGNHVCPR